MSIPDRRPVAVPVARFEAARAALADHPLDAPSEEMKRLAHDDPDALKRAIRARNFEFAQQALYQLSVVMPEYICWQLQKTLKDNWWKTAWERLNWSDGDDTYGMVRTYRRFPDDEATWPEIVTGLDFVCCCLLVQRMWNTVFQEVFPRDYRNAIGDLMTLRNALAHATLKGVDCKNTLIAAEKVMRPIHVLWADRFILNTGLVCNDSDADSFVKSWAT